MGHRAVSFAVAAALGALAVPMVVDNVLKISPRLLREAKAALFILAGSVPLLVVANTFRGALEAYSATRSAAAARLSSALDLRPGAGLGM